MSKLSERIVSFVILVAMLINLFPMNALAADNPPSSAGDENVIQEESVGNSQTASKVAVLGEVEDLREEDTKHFRLSDGSYVAVAYGLPVHFQDAEGKWQDIDNQLVLNPEAQTYSARTANTASVFASSLNSGFLFSSSKGDHSVAMSILDTEQADALMAGEAVQETVPETTAETIQETVPETTAETVQETVPETTAETVQETVPETTSATIPEIVPETTTETVWEPATETISETAQETYPEMVFETIPETTEVIAQENTEDIIQVVTDSTAPAVLSDAVDGIVAEQETEAGLPSDVVPDIQSEEVPATIEETSETIAPEISETTDVIAPDATDTVVNETEQTVEIETVPEITEETVAEFTEETVPEQTEEVIESAAFTYNRNAEATTVDNVSTMYTLQDDYGWDVNSVIPKNLESSILYENVFPNVDLMYTAYGYNIKEAIIVNQPLNSYRFDFLLQSNGLTPSLNEDNSISFTDIDGNLLYTIPAPFMEDKDGALSQNVTFTLTDTADGVVLTLVADKDWINAEDRKFPVVIDPTLIVASGYALQDIYSVYTMEAAPNDTTLGRQYLYVGAEPFNTKNDGRYRIFMHFNNMPTIPEGCDIVDSQLNLYRHAYRQRNCEQFPVGLYEVTSDKPSQYQDYYKWFSAMTWRRDMPSYDTTNAIDYAFAKDGKDYMHWDMTELTKKWYSTGTSNTTAALVMMNEEAIDTYYYFASAAFYAYSSGQHPPFMTVSYRNTSGIEPYYTYTTLGGGSAGTAYIADGTGQLKIGKELLSYASTVNPFSLNLIYNSDYFVSGKDNIPPVNLGLSMNMGSGWTLDCIQKVVPETVGNIPYLKYFDGDGTIHYFVNDTSKDSSSTFYYDEDGLGLKIKGTGGNSYLMSDDHGNEWVFTNNYLTSIKTSDGNETSINYSSGKITSIQQKNNGATPITVASFSYSGNNLTSVTDAANNTYTLTYTDGKLASIAKSNSTIAEYSYSGYHVVRMTDTESNYSLSFSYHDHKVANYKEMAGSSTGVEVSISYPNKSRTTYRDYGADRTGETADDILTHYLFDNAGRTANAYTTDNSGNILGATNAVYTAPNKDDNTNKWNNRTMRTSSIGIAGQQLMKNTSVELDAPAWSLNGTSIVTANPRTGNKSIKGTQTGNGAQSAQISSESLTAGTTYTFSAFINTKDVSSFNGKGIYLEVSKDSSWTSLPVNYKTSSVVDNGWIRISVTFTPTTAGVHTLALRNDGASGTFYADDFQLEKGEAPSSYNLVENGSFEMSSFGWTAGTGAAVETSGGAASSKGNMRINGDPTSNATNASQTITVNLPGTQTYVLSGWVWANAVPDRTGDPMDPNDRSKQCGLRATITYTDGSVEGHYIPFNADLSKTWQFTSTTIVPKSPAKTVKTIQVTTAYEENANVAYFDNISLLREAAQSMKYDKDGNLIRVDSPGLKEDENTYQNGNLIKKVTGGKGTYEYTYDTTYKHRLKSVTNSLITQAMGYDGVGNVTSTTLSGSGSKKITTSAEYGGSGNRLTSVTDESGAKVAYAYSNVNSQMMSLPTSITAPNGTVTTSTYDSMNRVTETGIAGTADVVYTYGSGNLNSVKRSDSAADAQTYSFTYDSFGNMLTLKVGSKVLATYSYNPNNGQLNRQTYGNGDSVSYTYDSLGRTKTVTFSDGRVMTYTYNGEGRLHSVVETGGKETVTYLYTYDSIGRLISSEQKCGNTSVLQTHQTYNANNQITGQGWNVDGTAYSESYTYNEKDGSLNTMTTASNDTLTMNYDELCRLQTVTGGPFTRGYVYRDISGEQTTMQVSQLNYHDLGSGLAFDYTYDNRGNIATYGATGKGVVTYTYDNQGQLLKAQGDKTYTYTYDSVGNILTASDGSASHTYSYDDADWKDLLTKYDGQTITYDESGNPTSYYNGTRWTFGWENGRQLTTASGKNNTLSFTYDTSGLRTSKTVNGVVHNYRYAGGKLLSESFGSTTLDFIYDSNGAPYAMITDQGSGNPATYYYVSNLQGDVIKLVDASGTTVATYDYDPYGKVIASSGSLADLNPLRYRGYYYDTETGFYYLQSRYYDPSISRFISADVFASTGQDILGFNTYCYCNNSPIAFRDSLGSIVETIFDVASLGVSLIEVAINPGDPWAWAGLVGDALDLIPFVTGLGETTRVVKTAREVTKYGDDVISAAKDLRNSKEVGKSLKKAVGVYEITYSNGYSYVGKGGFQRAIHSAEAHLDKTQEYVVTSIKWKRSKNNLYAFMEEYALQSKRNSENAKLFNKIWSPGKRYYQQLFN